MQKSIVLILLALFTIISCRNTFKVTPLDGKTITYGSIVKLYHPQTAFMLHSHGVRFGQFGVFSVTGYHVDDLGSYWQLRNKFKSATKLYTDPVQCGDTITVTSVIMDYFLRTQQTSIGLTSQLNQFVQGMTKQGPLDERVNWKIICQTKSTGQNVLFGDMIRLKHENTGKYVALERDYFYNERNCGIGCVLANQLEPHAIQSGQDDKTIFQIVAGMGFQKDNEEKEVKAQ